MERSPYIRNRSVAFVRAAGLLIRWSCGGTAGDSLPEGPLHRESRDRNGGKDRNVKEELEGGAPGLAVAAECQ